jgi:hypothetical protein
MEITMAGMTTRSLWFVILTGVIAAGILSRMIHTGWIVFDKHLGDALYAVMFYVIIRLCWIATPALRVATAAIVIMTALEFFQLTLIPLHMSASANTLTRITARLLGTEFSFWDLLAYAVGIGALWLIDSRR